MCSRCSQEGQGKRGTEEPLKMGDRTGNQPLPFYVSVKMIVKWYIINAMTTLEDFADLFRNVRRFFHFTTMVSGGTIN